MGTDPNERPSKDALRKRGYAALKRARAASGGHKVSADALWVEIQKMVEDGLRMPEISHALQRSERYLRMVKADHEANHVKIPRVTQGRNLQPGDDGYEETRFTVEGFISFFNRFSGKLMPEHVKPWVRAFIEERNVILNVPPRHAKSTVFSTWIPLFLVCIDRNVQILLVSETKDFAKGWATEIAGQLEMNQSLASVFGTFVPDKRGDFAWKPASGELIVRGRTRKAKGAQLTIQSRGMGQQVLGMEADYVIADDPTNQDVANSETTRERDINFLRQQVLTRIEPLITVDDQGNRVEDQGGRAIIIGQRVHPRDMYGELAAQTYSRGDKKGTPLWHVEKYPAISVWPEESDDGQAQVLWEARWPYEELMVTYERIGGRIPFETMYQQNPLPDVASPFLAEWIERCKDFNRNAYEGLERIVGVDDIARVCSVDPSPNNWNALVVLDSVYDRTAWGACVLEIDRFKGNLHDLVSKIRSAYERHRFDYLVFEDMGFAKWLYEDPLFRGFSNNFKVVKHKTNVNKNSTEYGVQSLAADLEFNRLSFPCGDAEGRRMTQLFEEEALVYGFGDTDDVVMATWFPKVHYRELRPIPRFAQAPAVGQGWSFLKRFQKPDGPVGYSFNT